MAVNYLSGTLKAARRVLGVHVHGRTGKQAKCVGRELDGQRFATRAAQREAFTKAAKACSGK